jgi:predicted O-methyltransferase YrrM
MITNITRYLQKYLSKSNYEIIRKNYRLFRDFKYLYYNTYEDLKYNENLISELGLDLQEIKLRLYQTNIQYDDENLSWHYHLFAGLNKYFEKKNIKINNILEIGTYDGKFSNFLSQIYPNAKITTIDLDEKSAEFKNSYNRQDTNVLNKFLIQRKINLKKKNISFISDDSLNIKKYFNTKKFDLIWIDGDHSNPQVSIDIINSLDLINNNGIIVNDDVTINKKSKYASNDAHKLLDFLEKKNLLKNHYLIKRIRKKNSYYKKYISVSFLKNSA